MEPFDVVPGVGDGPVQQAVGDQWTTAAAEVRGPEGDRATGPTEQPDGRLADVRLVVVGERVGEQEDLHAMSIGGPLGLEVRVSTGERPPGERGRQSTAVDPQEPLVQPAPARLRIAQFDAGARRPPQRPRSGRVAEHPIAPGQAVLAVVPVQELRLEPRHVHVGGAFGLARLAFQAEVEHLGNAGSASPARPAWPVNASLRALARPRVLSRSSRVA